MGEKTGISWTDHTFNPWWGCTKVSPGCDNCYAEAFDKRVSSQKKNGTDPHWGKGVSRREFGDKHWREPLLWDQNADRDKVKRKVFCASMADIMDDEAPEGARERLWNLIDNTPHLIWQLLTKRPHRYSRYLPAQFTFKNVWLGVTAESQEFYDVRLPILQRAAYEQKLPTWISYEPAIGPLSIVRGWVDYQAVPDWMICGGESGAGRREFKREWADSLLVECRRYGVKFFMKQDSALSSGQKGKLSDELWGTKELPGY